MSYFVIEDFKAGLDTRRMAVSSVPGSLLKLTNAHISRGGEIEKRPAFVQVCPLPANTFGLASVGTNMYIFGSIAAPALSADAPANLTYQKLDHPSGLAMTRVLHVNGFTGLPYVIAQYSDGSVWHFYNGTRIAAWNDGRARASFNVTAGSSGGTYATASFAVTGGINSDSDQISQIRLDNVPLLSAPVQHNGNNASTAAAIAAAINAFTGNPDFTATSSGTTVTITSTTPGSSLNGMVLSIQKTGTLLSDR